MKNKLLILAISAMSMTVIKVHGQTSPTNASDPVLESKRKEIDSLDKRLFEVLGARERVVKEIGVYKAKNKIPALQAARFQKVLEKGIEAGKKEGLSEDFVTDLLNAVHKESLRIEDALAGKKP